MRCFMNKSQYRLPIETSIFILSNDVSYHINYIVEIILKKRFWHHNFNLLLLFLDCLFYVDASQSVIYIEQTDIEISIFTRFN